MEAEQGDDLRDVIILLGCCGVGNDTIRAT